jgi:ribonuclease Z
MKKAVITLLALTLLGVAAFTFIYNTATGQDLFFNRAASTLMNANVDSFDGLRVVVCGSASPLGNDPNRAQACIAVVTPEHFFLFDVGAGSPLRIAQARLPMGRINGVFLTHYHSDHIAALGDVGQAAWIQGLPEQLQVFGPPGVDTVVAGFNAAYRLNRGYRTAHHGSKLLPPDLGAMRARSFTPGDVVWRDESLQITSFLVEHPPIEPAVGYRVDYRGRSIVISGDTNKTESLFKAAQGADLLFHDALSRTLLDPMIDIAAAASVPRMPTIMNDVISYHAEITKLPEAADAAGVKQLVFYHMVPVPANALAAKMFLRDLPDSIILASDLQTFDLPPNTDEILIRQP